MEETIILDTPLMRGDNKVTEVTLRKPNSGALRGVSLVAVMQMDVQALYIVVPRISTPSLTQQEVAAMDPADLMQIGMAVSGFLLPKSTREELSQNTSTTPSPTLQ